MKTPIVSFLNRYQKSGTIRLHMPGHKGVGGVIEGLDVTEICGADSLYEASGIIKESEENAGALFGAHTYYSTEGSSLSIRAMLALVCRYASSLGKRARILAAPNVHRVFLSAAALLDFDVEWYEGDGCDSYLSVSLDAHALDEYLSKNNVTALYVTSPDYLGKMQDIKALAEVCHKHGVLLLVDNAHGAYLRFLNSSLHPITLGADIVCDSAHKTLPALTGAAYLHISRALPSFFCENAKGAMALFGSTSPSYLILASLDKVNKYLASSYSEKLEKFLQRLDKCKAELSNHGYTLYGDEPLKLTISAKPYGYTGSSLARLLRSRGIECEFADRDFLVLMLTPENGVGAIKALTGALLSIPKRKPIKESAPKRERAPKACSIREATLASSETLPIDECLGRVLAEAGVSCPPAVPIATVGEVLCESAIGAMKYYGIKTARVIKKSE